MERCKLRRTSFLDGVFEAATEVGSEAVVRLPRGELDFGPAQPVGVLSDAADDVLVVPGVVAVRADSELAAQLSDSDSFERVKTGLESGPIVFRARAGSGVDGVRAMLDLVAKTTGGPDRSVAAPVLGFVSHQRVKTSDDPESTGPLPSPIRSRRGAGSVVHVLDTGLADDFGWRTTSLAPASVADVDPLEGSLAPGFLGRAAGHGTFVASLCHQVAPGARVVVHRVAGTEGFVDELTLAERLNTIGRQDDAPDVVVLAFGGYSVKLGSFGTTGKGDSWLRPLVLRAAVLDLLARCPDTIVVASAGNNDSTDPCFPAAFSADPEFDGRVVAVAALDASGYRWAYSNYGSWVSASTIGVRLRGPYVAGREHPSNEPDGSPETFVAPAFATWSGTSFAAPLVAGRIVEMQTALAAELGRSVPATEAWQVLRAASKPQREGRCGVHVLVDGVAYD